MPIQMILDFVGYIQSFDFIMHLLVLVFVFLYGGLESIVFLLLKVEKHTILVSLILNILVVVVVLFPVFLDTYQMILLFRKISLFVIPLIYLSKILLIKRVSIDRYLQSVAISLPLFLFIFVFMINQVI